MTKHAAPGIINHVIFWVAAILVAAFALFPHYWGTWRSTHVEAVEKGEAQLISLTLRIEGMTCQACARQAEMALLQVPGVRAASVNYTDSNAMLTLDENSLPAISDLSKAVKSVGFTAEKID